MSCLGGLDVLTVLEGQGPHQQTYPPQYLHHHCHYQQYCHHLTGPM